jgi:hypothetical protein
VGNLGCGIVEVTFLAAENVRDFHNGKNIYIWTSYSVPAGYFGVFALRNRKTMFWNETLGRENADRTLGDLQYIGDDCYANPLVKLCGLSWRRNAAHCQAESRLRAYILQIAISSQEIHQDHADRLGPRHRLLSRPPANRTVVARSQELKLTSSW